MRDAPQWISLRQGVSVLASTELDDLAAKEVISDRIRDGIIHVKAELYSENLAFGSLHWSRPQQISARTRLVMADRAIPLTDHIVDPTIWLRSRDWTADVDLWRWGAGDLVLHYVGEKQRTWRVQMWNVSLDASGLELMAKPAASDTRRIASNRGAKRGNDWDEWIAALVQLIHEEGLPSKSSGEQLVKRVNEKVKAEGFAELPLAKAESVTLAVLRRLRQA